MVAFLILGSCFILLIYEFISGSLVYSFFNDLNVLFQTISPLWVAIQAFVSCVGIFLMTYLSSFRCRSTPRNIFNDLPVFFQQPVPAAANPAVPGRSALPASKNVLRDVGLRCLGVPGDTTWTIWVFSWKQNQQYIILKHDKV